MPKTKKEELTGQAIEAMTRSEREALIAGIESKTTEELLGESKPLTSAQRQRFNRWKKKANRGRPTVGKGAKMVGVTIEKGLLKRADAYAKTHGLKRTELIAQALRIVIGDNAA